LIIRGRQYLENFLHFVNTIAGIVCEKMKFPIDDSFSKQIQIHPMDILGITMADTIFRGKKREDVHG